MSGCTALHDNHKNSRKVREGDVIVLVNSNNALMLGYAIVAGPFRAHTEDVYSGVDSHYNRWECPIESYKIFASPIMMKQIGRFCGIAEGDKTLSNIHRIGRSSFERPYYSGAGHKEIEESFRLFVLTMIGEN